MDSAVISNSGRPGLGLGFQGAERGILTREISDRDAAPRKAKALFVWNRAFTIFRVGRAGICGQEDSGVGELRRFGRVGPTSAARNHAGAAYLPDFGRWVKRAKRVRI